MTKSNREVFGSGGAAEWVEVGAWRNSQLEPAAVALSDASRRMVEEWAQFPQYIYSTFAPLSARVVGIDLAAPGTRAEAEAAIAVAEAAPLPEIEPGMIVRSRDPKVVAAGEHVVFEVHGAIVYSRQDASVTGRGYIGHLDNVRKFCDVVGLQLADGRRVMVGEQRKSPPGFVYAVTGIGTGGQVRIAYIYMDRGASSWHALQMIGDEIVRPAGKSGGNTNVQVHVTVNGNQKPDEIARGVAEVVRDLTQRPAGIAPIPANGPTRRDVCGAIYKEVPAVPALQRVATVESIAYLLGFQSPAMSVDNPAGLAAKRVLWGLRGAPKAGEKMNPAWRAAIGEALYLNEPPAPAWLAPGVEVRGYFKGTREVYAVDKTKVVLSSLLGGDSEVIPLGLFLREYEPVGATPPRAPGHVDTIAITVTPPKPAPTLDTAMGADLDSLGEALGVRRKIDREGIRERDAGYRARLHVAEYRRRLDAALAADKGPFAKARAAAMRNGLPEASVCCDGQIAALLETLVVYENVRGGVREPRPDARAKTGQEYGAACRRHDVSGHALDGILAAYERARGL